MEEIKKPEYVVLDLETYDRIKDNAENFEKLYNDLLNELEKCVIKLDKNGKEFVPGYGFYLEDPVKTVQIKMEKLSKVLNVENYIIEIVR